jgi:hypothetical protein
MSPPAHDTTFAAAARPVVVAIEDRNLADDGIPELPERRSVRTVE